MNKFRLSALAMAGSLILGLGAAGPALASSTGDANAGDVWLDNVGQPAGPGHEMDPHLACQDINLWGAGLADSSGTFTINGWPPSGSKEVDYSDSWSYSPSQGGDQIVATISISSLIATAQANGDHAAHNGYHFKLDFSQDPQKHKTFWVDCPASYVPSSETSTSPAQGQSKPSSGSRPTTRRTRHRLRARHRRRHRRHRISRRPRTARGFTG